LTDNAGAPLSSTEFDLYSWDNQHVATVYTDAAGRFTLPSLPHGVYRIEGRYAGRSFSQSLTVNSESQIMDLHTNFELRDVAVAPRPAADNATAVSANDLSAPKSARKLYRKATDALAHNDINRALQSIGAAIREAPAWGRAYFFRGVLFTGLRRFVPAEQDLKNAVRFNAASNFLAALGSLYLRAGRVGDAEFYLHRARQVTPVSWQAYFESAQLEMVRKDYPAARADAQRSLNAGCAAPRCRLLAAEAEINTGDLAQAGRELANYISAEPKDPNLPLLRAQLQQISAYLKGGAASAAGAPAGVAAPQTTSEQH
jgi:tetratricopeptide (TPR) repeat protein